MVAAGHSAAYDAAVGLGAPLVPAIQGTRLRWLYRYSIWHPKTVIAVAIVATAAIAPGILRLKLRTDGHALVPADAPEVVFDRNVRDEFGVEDPIVVLIRSADTNGVFNPHTVRLVQHLTQEFRKIEGVRRSDVSSLETEHNYRVKQGSLTFRRLLEPLPQTRAELDLLRHDVRAIKLYDGTIIGFDDASASIMVGVPPQMGRAPLYARVQSIVDGLGDVPEEIHIIGAPVAEALLGTHILEDLGVPHAALGHRLARSEEPTWRFPRNLYEVRRFIAWHLGLAPAAIAIMMLVFLVSFGRLLAAVMPLLEVLACLVATFGLMGWFNVPVYLTIAVLPVILTVSGVQDEIHLFARCVREVHARPGHDHRLAVQAAFDAMYSPVLKTTVTTAVGFASFIFTPLAPVRAFGAFATVGMAFCMLWSFAVVPAQLAMTDPRHWMRGRPGAGGELFGLGPFFARLSARVVRYRVIILGATGLLVVLAPLGVRKIVVQDSWIDGFARDSDFYQATQQFNADFLGTHMLLLWVDAGHAMIQGELREDAIRDHTFLLPADTVDDPQQLVGQTLDLSRTGTPTTAPAAPLPRNMPVRWESGRSRIETAVREGEHLVITTPRAHALIRTLIGLTAGEKLAYTITPRRLTRPEVLETLRGLEAFVRTRTAEAVGGVIGPTDYVATTRFMKTHREDQRRLPDTAEDTTQAWTDYRRIRGEDRLRQIVDPDFSRALVSVFMKNANFIDTQRLMDDIRAYEREHLQPAGIKLDFAGDVAVSQTLIRAIVSTQLRSVIGAPLGILVITVILGRSLRWGSLAVLPCALGLLLNFAVIGLVGMPLGVASSMFASMILGVGVDYAIHLLEHYRTTHAAGASRDAALAEAVAHTGPAILVDALAVALGFSVMLLSQVPANARLGALLVLSLAGCLAVTLLVLPALLSLGREGHEQPPAAT